MLIGQKTVGKLQTAEVRGGLLVSTHAVKPSLILREKNKFVGFRADLSLKPERENHTIDLPDPLVVKKNMHPKCT
jgi:hypothetical protein